MKKDKLVKKHQEVLYCSVPYKVKNFLDSFSADLRKDIVNRALYFYFSEGHYQEFFSFLNEEEIKYIKEKIFEIYGISEVNIKTKKRKKTISKKTEINKKENIDKKDKEKEKMNDVLSIDEKIIDEFDY